MTIEAREAGADSAKRRQILDGARRVFLADGFDGASMNDIARAAGVSKGTLYVYFNSKEDLFEALIREDRKQQAERIVFPADDGDPRPALASFGRQLIALMTQPELIAQVRIVIAATAKFPNLGRVFYESGPRYGVIKLAERLEAWRGQGVLQFGDGHLAARQFIDLCKSGVFQGCLFGLSETASPEAIARSVDAAVEVFMRAYGVGEAKTTG
ncbi:MAG TPA: TetR/AcrR family transcriptional regulator [Roseiarcus sp.]|nr:TetR/AcrR family transcriptional regulator [Roseiarcus sp.]